MPTPKVPVEIRFWAKVNKTNDCWLWMGAPMADGYGYIKIHGRVVRAHRFAYELANGTIPNDLELDHLCRTPLCVRPEHLEAVTHKVNDLRGMSPLARHARQTHCKRGHIFDEANTYLYRTWRICKACRRLRDTAHRNTN